MIIYQIIILVATIVAMMIFHEYGHYAIAKELGGKAVIKWGGLFTEVSGLTVKQQVKAYWVGILAGLFPIFAYIIGNGFIGLFVGGPLLLWYVWFGCSEDFKAIKELRR